MAGEVFIGQPGWKSHMTKFLTGQRYHGTILVEKTVDPTFPNGLKGSHRLGPNTFILDITEISDTKIRMKERDGVKTEFQGFVSDELSTPTVAVVTGVYAIPAVIPKSRKAKGKGKRSLVDAGQNDGIWVATKP